MVRRQRHGLRLLTLEAEREIALDLNSHSTFVQQIFKVSA